MHPNRLFRQQSREYALQVAKDQGFGTFLINAEPYPLSSHIPFIIGQTPENDLEDQVEFHLAKNNPMRNLLEGGVNAKLSIMVAHTYISPDWYGLPDQVPTWNYVAIDLTGHAVAQSPEWLIGHLERLSERFESGIENKEPWTPDLMSADVRAQMQRGIFGISMKIENVDSTVKLNQNKSVEARMGVIDALSKTRSSGDTIYIAEQMRKLTT